MELTERQRHMLDDAYRKKTLGESLTSDEIDMIIAFERESALKTDEHMKLVECMQAESEAAIEETRKTADMMREVLLDKCNAEKTKFERFLKDEPQQK